MPATCWIVRLKGKVIDMVFFDSDIPKDEVYRSLVNHDGYNPAITVSKRRSANNGRAE